MTQNLPQYTAESTVQPGPLVDSSPIFSAVKQTLGGISRETLGIAQQNADKLAQQRGEESGSQLGFAPTKGTGQATRVFNQAALQANKATLANDVSSNVNQNLQSASQNINEDSLPAFNSGMAGYAKGLLSTIPVENRAYAENLLAYHTSRATQQLQSKVNQRNHALGAAAFYGNYQSTINQSANAARAGDMTAALSFKTQAQQQAQTALDGQIVSGGQFVSIDRNADTQINEQDAMGKYAQSLKDGKGQDFINEFTTGSTWNKQFNPIQKQAIVQKMLNMGRQLAENQGVNSQTIGQTKKDLLLQALNGIDPAKESPQRMAAVEEFDPDGYPQFQQEVDLSKTQHAVVSGAQNQTIGEVQATIGGMLSPQTPQELKDPGAALRESFRKSTAIRLQQGLSDFAKDPAAVTQTSPAYLNAVTSYKNKLPSPEDQQAINGFITTGQLPTNPQDFQAVQGFVNVQSNTQLAIQKQRGLPESQWRVMSNAQSASVVSSINAEGPEAGLGRLSAMQKLYGGNFNYVMRGLVKHGLHANMQMFVGMANNPATEPYLNDALSAAQLNTKDTKQFFGESGAKAVLPSIKNDVLKESATWQSSLNSYQSSPGALNQQASMIAMVQKMAEFYVIRDKVDPAVAAKQAYTRLVGDQYSEINNNYRVAASVDPATVRGMMKEMDSAATASNFKILQPANPNITTKRQQENDFRTAIQNGHWASDPSHDGTAWFKVDTAGRRVLQANGQPYEFTAADMHDPTFLAKLNAKVEIAKKTVPSDIKVPSIQGALPTAIDIGRFIQESPAQRIKRTGALLSGAAKDVGKGAAGLAEKAKQEAQSGTGKELLETGLL